MKTKADLYCNNYIKKQKFCTYLAMSRILNVGSRKGGGYFILWIRHNIKTGVNSASNMSHPHGLLTKGTLLFTLKFNSYTYAQRPYITETMHSYTLPLLCLSGLHLSLQTGGSAVCGHS